MKRLKAAFGLLSLAGALVGGMPAWADTGGIVQGSNGQLLSQVTTMAGTGDFDYKNEAVLAAAFRSPEGLLAMADGSLIVADTKNHVIRKLAKERVSTLAGPPIVLKKNAAGIPIGTLLDGAEDKALFQSPVGMAADSQGNIYVADSDNHAIRKIDSSGRVTTLAGNGVLGHDDGKGAKASFDHPQDVAVDKEGNVFVADTLNHAIRKITPDGTVTTLNALSTRAVEISPGQALLAGDYLDGDLKTAKFNEPSSLVFDAKGNLYVSDTGNNRIRYIDFSTNRVTTVAGGGAAADGKSVYGPGLLYAEGDYADGDAAKAKFNAPQGLAIDSEGGLIIADSLNHSIRYLKDGVVSTLAGSLNQSAGEFDGVDRYAGMYSPADVAVLADGSIAVADAYNNKIRNIRFYRFPAGVNLDDADGNDDIQVVYNSFLITFQTPPEIVNGRTMVPVRAIAEELGYKVDYAETDDGVQTVVLTKGDLKIELYIGQTGIQRTETGKPPVVETTDVEPFIDSDLTYVPVRFFAEEAGMDVQWNDAHRVVIIRPQTSVK